MSRSAKQTSRDMFWSTGREGGGQRKLLPLGREELALQRLLPSTCRRGQGDRSSGVSLGRQAATVNRDRVERGLRDSGHQSSAGGMMQIGNT